MSGSSVNLYIDLDSVIVGSLDELVGYVDINERRKVSTVAKVVGEEEETEREGHTIVNGSRLFCIWGTEGLSNEVLIFLIDFENGIIDLGTLYGLNCTCTVLRTCTV